MQALDGAQVSIVDWLFFGVLFWQLKKAIQPNSATPEKSSGIFSTIPREDLSQPCKDTWSLVVFSQYVTLMVMVVLLVNGISILLGVTVHKACSKIDTTCIPLVNTLSRASAMLATVLVFFRFAGNLFCTLTLPGIITGTPCDTMTATALHTLLAADFLGLLQVVGFCVLFVKMAQGREAEATAYLVLPDENPEEATKAPA